MDDRTASDAVILLLGTSLVFADPTAWRHHGVFLGACVALFVTADAPTGREGLPSVLLLTAAVVLGVLVPVVDTALRRLPGAASRTPAAA
jgi:hypothetical protein